MSIPPIGTSDWNRCGSDHDRFRRHALYACVTQSISHVKSAGTVIGNKSIAAIRYGTDKDQP